MIGNHEQDEETGEVNHEGREERKEHLGGRTRSTSPAFGSLSRRQLEFAIVPECFPLRGLCALRGSIVCPTCSGPISVVDALVDMIRLRRGKIAGILSSSIARIGIAWLVSGCVQEKASPYTSTQLAGFVFLVAYLVAIV
jgi:hypothetical protein